ncbi:uncharacterized protein EI97DRAFT_497001 [Westerdykella ornata]|uniref:laccase n=1 Tax=Westerdykella ornata TaxID=318751 RepID=A0A6A6J625_WESOR|nr:uncharacterized protein EI97DRAFT_497001 [Westerdykella ornata]KAF2271885.1 hypothetical protein EI97DRAFT_497001 [Westerdykella ornata]
MYGTQVLKWLTTAINITTPATIATPPTSETSGSVVARAECENSPTSRQCWTGNFSIDTDFHHTWPDTGVTVSYDFRIQNRTMAPDGVPKWMAVMNGQFPGPTIYADWGDTISVSVTNELENNGTAIHWHGVRQFGSPDMDGTAGISECPIPSGQTRTYTFKATQHGTSWYHPHYSVQYGNGLVGGIVINGPAVSNYDIDMGVLTFMDWFHEPIFEVNAATLHSSGPPTAQNLLINGTMVYKTLGRYHETTLTPGMRHRLRLINTGFNNHVHVKLEDHPFEVIAVDFTAIEPYVTDSLSIGIGQRYDVIIEANQTNNSTARAIFHYDGSTTPVDISTTTELPTGCHDEANVEPWVRTAVPQNVPEELLLGFQSNDTTVGETLVQWLINGSRIAVNHSYPTMQGLIDGVSDWPKDNNVYKLGQANKWWYWVIQAGGETGPPDHPIHLHGHDFHVLGSARNRTWDGDISTLRFSNPPRRDTAMLPSLGYLVLAFESNNPGIWLMHCHVPFHQSQGFALQFLEREDEILQMIDTAAVEDRCVAWREFATARIEHTPGDSGIRLH